MSDERLLNEDDPKRAEEAAIRWLIRNAESEIESMRTDSTAMSTQREAERRLREKRHANRRIDQILSAGRTFATAAAGVALLVILVSFAPPIPDDSSGPAETIAALFYPVAAFAIAAFGLIARAIAELRSS